MPTVADSNDSFVVPIGAANRGEDAMPDVNTNKGVKALDHARKLIHEYEVTPRSIPASGADGNHQTFQEGNTIFMRNWPYAFSLFEDETPVTDKFDVMTMPKAIPTPTTPVWTAGACSSTASPTKTPEPRTS